MEEESTLRERGATADPVIALYEQHVDRTLLRQNLRRSPSERIANLMALQRLAAEAQRAGARLRGSP